MGLNRSVQLVVTFWLWTIKETLAVVVGHDKGTPVPYHVHGSNTTLACLARRGLHLCHQSVRSEVVHPHDSVLIADEKLGLVRMQYDGIQRDPRIVATLTPRRTQVPDLDTAVVRARVHPLAVALEPQGRDVRRVSVVARHVVGIVTVDFKETNVWIPRGCNVLLVGRDLKAIDLLEGANTGSVIKTGTI